MDYQDLEVEEFMEAFKSAENAVLLDVRTPLETSQGKVEGAKESDFNGGQFEMEFADWDKDKSYFIYCRSGARSGRACQIMAEAGFKGLHNMVGGFIAYETMY